MNDKQLLIKLTKAHKCIRIRLWFILGATLANTFSIALLVALLAVSGCAKKQTIGDVLYHMGDEVDYKGIRTEERKNKVKSEMDK